MKMSKTVLIYSFLITASLMGCVPGALACSTGDKAQVKWKGSWYPATVLKAKGNKCYVHYDGYDNSWDEWVGPGRIQVSGVSPASIPVAVAPSAYSEGEAVMVQWKGSWWPAHVLKVGSDRWYIHYDNYGSSWDEWVGPGRIRKR